MNKRHSIFFVISIALICALLPYSRVAANDCIAHPWGLVSWWPGDGNANDIRNGNDGTINGATFAAGKIGQAFSFDGVDDYVQVSNSPLLEPQNITVDAWVRSSDPGSYAYILSKGASACTAGSYAFYTGGSGGLIFYIFNGSTYVLSPNAGSAIWDGNWHHVAGTFDGSYVRLYVDGIAIGSGTSTSITIGYGLPTTNDLFIGRYGTTCVPRFNGEVDEVEIYNRALSQSEIQALYAAGSVGKCKPVKKNYADITQNGSFWLGAHDRWDLKKCDLTISYRLDMFGYIPPMGNTAWSSVGVGEGAWGWMASGAPEAAVTNPNSQDLDDKLNLGAPARYDEASYDATDPESIVSTPIGNPWLNYGVWFDRDGVDPWQALMWGMINGVTYNTGGIYEVAVNYHALTTSLNQGTMFATVNGVQTGFYDTWKDDQPDHYPVGKSISGNLSNLRGLASIWGENVNVYDLTFTGCHYLMAVIDIKPGSDPNSINLGEQGLLPVAILGTENFDVSTVSPATINIGGFSLATRGSAKAPKLAYSYEDVNGDGYMDLMAFFDVPTLVSAGILTETTTALTLTGSTFDNVPIQGTDSVRIVP